MSPAKPSPVGAAPIVVILRLGASAQRRALYKLDPDCADGSCRRRWLGAGEWVSLSHAV
eukprot:gene46996-34081_t